MKLIIIIIMHMISLFLLIILFSFNPEDPSWIQKTCNESTYNFGGIVGAKVSDFLFFIFGILAYVIPIFIVLNIWKIYFQKINITIIGILSKCLNFLVLISMCCGYVQLNIKNTFYFSVGGILGDILCDFFSLYIDKRIYMNLIFLFIISAICIFLYDFYFLSIFNVGFKKCLKYILYKFKNFFKYEKNKNYNDLIQSQNSFNTNQMFYLNKHRIISSRSIFNLCKIRKMDNICMKFNKYVFQSGSNLKRYLNKLLYDSHMKNCNYRSDIFKKKNNYVNHYKINIYDDYKKRCIFNFFLKKKYFKYHIKYDKPIPLNARKSFFKMINNECNKISFNRIKDTSISSIFYAKHPISFNKSIKLKDTPIITPKTIIEKNNKNEQLDCFKNNIDFPDFSLLIPSTSDKTMDTLELKNFSKLLEEKLLEYRIIAKVVNVFQGPVITRFELNLSPGIKSSKISHLSLDLARSLSLPSVRVIEIIAGTPYIGLEIPNKKRHVVRLHEIISSDDFQKFNTPLALVLGKDVLGKPIIIDLKFMPHLLIAGTTGSGKSVGINVMIISMLYKASPETIRFVMIDPKILELSIYSNIPHILNKVIVNMKDVHSALQWCVEEMNRRYTLMAMLGVRDLENYNIFIEKIFNKSKNMSYFENKMKIKFSDFNLKKLPYIVIIIDEFADLIYSTSNIIEELITRLTQKARASGIHLILATQRPSVNVITGLIKANIPARIAFTVSSKIDSRTILGQNGAENLLGMGDMLYVSPNSSVPVRIHGAFVCDQEIQSVVNFWKNKLISS